MFYNPHLVVNIFNRAGKSGTGLSKCPNCHAINQFFYRQFRTKKRLAEGLKPNVPPDGGGVGGLGGRSLLSSLTGPLVFTVGFSGVAISAAAVWQYENMRTRKGYLIRSNVSLNVVDVDQFLNTMKP